jgi:E3 ubiquitin-protein ligase DRIP
VEILLGDKPVLCSMQLQNLMEMWLETMSKNERVETSVGSSAKDFVMVLSYRRKA